MLREGAAYAARNPESYQANMHALSFLYLSHLRTKKNGGPRQQAAPPPPPPQFSFGPRRG